MISHFPLPDFLIFQLSDSTVYFVGSHKEIAHHAAPLLNQLPVKVVAASDVVAATQPGDVAVFFSEHFERFRSAIEQLKKNRVATLYMIDGILEWRNAWENKPDEVACPHTMRPVLCDKVACIGENQARILNGWNNHGKVEVVGVPRFDRYHQPAPKHDDPPRKFRLLVMTAKTPAFTDAQLCIVKQSLIDLKAAAEKRSEQIEVVWRLTRGLENFLDVANSNNDLTGNELFEHLQSVDAVISTPSTGIVESMLAGKPTATLDYHNCPEYLSPAWRISAASQIDAVVNELQNPSDQKLFFQNMTLNQALYRESSATDRMVALIQKMQSDAAAQIATGNKTLRFAPQLLPLPLASSNVLDHRTLFPEDTAFAEQDHTALQALLSNARRRIGRLERRVEVLESDLNAAHDVFDKMRAHPVAGPLIRLRERVLDTVFKTQGEVVAKPK